MPETTSAAAGMVRLYSLRPGAEFTFAPRLGRFRITGRVPGGNRLIYEGIDLDAQEVAPKPVVAMSNWWVWDLTEKGA